jgi:hypothetical protein
MKKLLTIILVSIFSIAFGQKAKPRTNYGPNFGIISNSEKFESNTLQFGFAVRRIYKWRYIQPELNLFLNSKTSEFSEMAIPILFGVRALKTIRFNIGAELRSNLSFVGTSKRGLNQLSYESTPTFVSPIAGMGVDIGRVCLDFRVSTQFNMSISFLFGKRKS